MTSEQPEKQRRADMVWPIVIVLGSVIAMGAAMGGLQAAADKGAAIMPPIIGGVIALVAGAGVLALYVRRVGIFWKDWTRRKRLYWGSLALAAVLGILTSMMMRINQIDTGSDIVFSYSRLPVNLAIALSLIWVVGLAVSITIYQRSIDDHEQQAYLWAGLAGFYALVIPAPAWWVLARAEMVPPIDGMILFLVALVANIVVYLWLKFR